VPRDVVKLQPRLLQQRVEGGIQRVRDVEVLAVNEDDRPEPIELRLVRPLLTNGQLFAGQRRRRTIPPPAFKYLSRILRPSMVVMLVTAVLSVTALAET
jgi:hypothetical protein